MYLGRWRWHGLVAVKHLKVADVRRERAFVREAELLHTLRHPNIVSLLGACLEPGRVRCNAGLRCLFARTSRPPGKHPKVPKGFQPSGDRVMVGVPQAFIGCISLGKCCAPYLNRAAIATHVWTMCNEGLRHTTCMQCRHLHHCSQTHGTV